MDIHEFNKSVLESLNIVDSGDGFLSDSGEGFLSRRDILDDTLTPFIVNKKRAILPTPKNLRNPPENTIVYHPLSENITRSESDMIKAMRDTAMYRVTIVAATLLQNMANVAASPDQHSKLGSKASKFLSELPEFDVKTAEFLENKILSKVGPQPERRLIHIGLHKGNKSDGVLRIAKFKFPIMEEILSDSPTIMETKWPSKKVHRNIRKLFELVFGDEETRSSFDCGSKNHTAPYFHALMSGYYNISVHFNAMIDTHSKLLGSDLAARLKVNLDWANEMENLAELRRVVPPQEGNEGAIIVSEGKGSTERPRGLAGKIPPPASRDSDVSETVEPLPWEDEEEAVERVRSERTDRPIRSDRRDDTRRQPSTQRRGITLDERERNRRGGRDDFGRGHRDDRFGRDRFDDDRFGRRDIRRGGRDRGRGGRSSRDDFGRGHRSGRF